jgi:hypothetical protein
MVFQYVKQTAETLKVNIKQSKISQISIQHTKAASFQNGQGKILNHRRY